MDDPTPGLRGLDAIPTRKPSASRRPAKAFNPVARPESQLFTAPMSGEHVVHGFANRDLRDTLLAPSVQLPFLFKGQADRRRPPKERVVGVVVGSASRAYPWPVLLKQRVVHDSVGGEPVVIFYRQGALSALDQTHIEQSKAVGATAVFSAAVEGKTLTFEAVAEGFRDRETGSLWNLLGHAVKGPMAGKRLRAIPHVDAFWFAWAAFHPSTTIYTGP